MRIFDLHADVSEIMKMYPENETAVLKKDWVSKWNKGEILYTSAASFFAGDESWETMVKTVERVKKDIEDSHIPVITAPEDLNENSDSVVRNLPTVLGSQVVLGWFGMVLSWFGPSLTRGV